MDLASQSLPSRLTVAPRVSCAPHEGIGGRHTRRVTISPRASLSRPPTKPTASQPSRGARAARPLRDGRGDTVRGGVQAVRLGLLLQLREPDQLLLQHGARLLRLHGRRRGPQGRRRTDRARAR
jgi:hypothetical protein